MIQGKGILPSSEPNKDFYWKTGLFSFLIPSSLKLLQMQRQNLNTTRTHRDIFYHAQQTNPFSDVKVHYVADTEFSTM